MSARCSTCGAAITPLGPNRIWRELHPGETYTPREWVDELNNKAASSPTWHEHTPQHTPCHADGQGPCVADCCPIKGRPAPAWCPQSHARCTHPQHTHKKVPAHPTGGESFTCSCGYAAEYVVLDDGLPGEWVDVTLPE